MSSTRTASLGTGRVRRYEKENKGYLAEMEDLKNEIESLSKSRSQAVSMSKEFESKLVEMNGKVDDAIRQLSDANGAKARLMEENLTYSRQLEGAQFELASLQTTYRRTQSDLDDARLHLESEMAVRLAAMNERHHRALVSDEPHAAVDREDLSNGSGVDEVAARRRSRSQGGTAETSD